jgi:hypothetical protein
MTSTTHDERLCEILAHPGDKLFGSFWLDNQTWTSLRAVLIMYGDRIDIPHVARPYQSPERHREQRTKYYD